MIAKLTPNLRHANPNLVKTAAQNALKLPSNYLMAAITDLLLNNLDLLNIVRDQALVGKEVPRLKPA